MRQLRLIALASGLAMASLSFAASTHSASQTITVSPSQHVVKISLPANATTGYQWFVEGYDNSLFTLNGYTYKAPSGHRVGAGGVAEFTFSVKPEFHVAPQLSKMTFVYGQAWNMETATSKEITVSSIPNFTEEEHNHHESSHKEKSSSDHHESHHEEMSTTTPPPSSDADMGPQAQTPPPATSAGPADSADASGSAANAGSAQSPDNNWLSIPSSS